MLCFEFMPTAEFPWKTCSTFRRRPGSPRRPLKFFGNGRNATPTQSSIFHPPTDFPVCDLEVYVGQPKGSLSLAEGTDLKSEMCSWAKHVPFAASLAVQVGSSFGPCLVSCLM